MFSNLSRVVCVALSGLAAAAAVIGCTTTADPSGDAVPVETASYGGIVRNAVGGAGVEGAVVTLTREVTAAASTREAVVATTDGSGRFAFTGLAPGKYRAKVEPPSGGGYIAMGPSELDLEANKGKTDSLPIISRADIEGAHVRVDPSEAALEPGSSQRFTAVLVRSDGSEVRAFYPLWAVSDTTGDLEVGMDGSCTYTAGAREGIVQIAASVGDHLKPNGYIFATATITVGKSTPVEPPDKPSNVILEEDFEGASAGTYIGDMPGWEPRYSATLYPAEWHVVSDQSVSGSHSLQLYGSHGGCWSGVAYHSLSSTPDVVYLEASLMASGEMGQGCHQSDASVGLGNDDGTWGTSVVGMGIILHAGVPAIATSGSVLDSPPVLVPNVEIGRWYLCRARLDIPADRADYWVDGKYVGHIDGLPTTFYSWVACCSGDGRGWIDDIRVWTE